MKRRGFFGALAGLFLSPLGLKAKPDWRIWLRPKSKNSAEVERELERVLREMEDDFWRPPTKGDEPYGISYWLKKED